MATTSRRENFLAFSTSLTGCAPDVLDSADAAANYLQTFDAGVKAANVDAILDTYGRQISTGGMTPEQAVAAILAGSFDRPGAWSLSKGTRALLKLWFTGYWVDTTGSADPPPPYSSAQSYARGLVWLVAQAHPVGVSNLRFGYWNNVPPPLDEYVGKIT